MNKIKLTQETILKTRSWYADNQDACKHDVLSGKVKVNDIDGYIIYCDDSKTAYLSGKYDHTLAFLQRAHFIQTGEMIALLG